MFYLLLGAMVCASRTIFAKVFSLGMSGTLMFYLVGRLQRYGSITVNATQICEIYACTNFTPIRVSFFRTVELSKFVQISYHSGHFGEFRRQCSRHSHEFRVKLQNLHEFHTKLVQIWYKFGTKFRTFRPNVPEEVAGILFWRHVSVWGGIFAESWGLKVGCAVCSIRYVILTPERSFLSKKREKMGLIHVKFKRHLTAHFAPVHEGYMGTP